MLRSWFRLAAVGSAIVASVGPVICAQ